MESETEKHFRRKNRDQTVGRVIAVIWFLPIILLLGMCVGAGLGGG